MPWEDKKWHFFCVREKLHGKGNQFRRKGVSGFWKSTCEEEKIIDGETGECIGKKRILVFHKGRHPGKRTEWVIHEYALNNHLPDQVYTCSKFSMPMLNVLLHSALRS